MEHDERDPDTTDGTRGAWRVVGVAAGALGFALMATPVFAGPPADTALLLASLSVIDPPIATPFGPYGLGPLLPAFPVPVGNLSADGSLSLAFTLPASTPPFTTVALQGLVGSSLTNVTVLQVF